MVWLGGCGAAYRAGLLLLQRVRLRLHAVSVNVRQRDTLRRRHHQVVVLVLERKASLQKAHSRNTHTATRLDG